MELFSHIRRSIYDPSYYGDIVKRRPLSYSIKYFYSLVLVIAVVMSVFYGFILIPVVSSFLNSFGTSAVDYYPDELVITIENGEASMNMPSPYFLPLPNEFRSAEMRDIENLLVIDTERQFSIDLWKEYKSAVWLTKDAIIYKDSYDHQGADDIRITSLEEVPDTVVNKTLIASWMRALEPFYKFVPPLLIFGIFFGMLFMLSIYLVYLVFGGLLVLLIAHFKSIKLSYKKAYQVGIHAITLGMIFNFLKLTLLAGSPHVRFLFTILMCVVVWMNLKKEEIEEDNQEEVKIEPVSYA